jgi:hypothetical protein
VTHEIVDAPFEAAHAVQRRHGAGDDDDVEIVGPQSTVIMSEPPER